MSRFLRLLVLFLLPLLLLALAAEVYVWHLPNSYRIKRAAMTRMADSVEVIILGNSHAFFGLRPDLMSKPTLNLANVSQTLDYDLLLLADYQPRCPRLRRVYLVVDHSNFFDLWQLHFPSFVLRYP